MSPAEKSPTPRGDDCVNLSPESQPLCGMITQGIRIAIDVVRAVRDGELSAAMGNGANRPDIHDSEF